MATQFIIIGSNQPTSPATTSTEETQQNQTNENRDHRVFEQMNNILADETISLQELEAPENQDFANYLVEVLGYGSVRAFVLAHASRTGTRFENFQTEIPLRSESVNAIRESITGSIYGEGLRIRANESSQLPTDIDNSLSFIEFTLLDGQKITFDGPNAGEAAHAFAIAYNNSDTFAQNMHTLVEEHNGHYGFHLLPLKHTEKGITVGMNFSGFDLPMQKSGVFLQSEFNYNILKTIIHEVGHDLHGDHDDLHDGGESHSREQSMFLSIVVNDIETAGIDTDINVDADDYSSDTLIFNTTFKSNNHQTVRSSPRADYENYQAIYEDIEAAINNGDFATAYEMWREVPADAEIDLSFKRPKTGWGETEAFNIRTLFLQDLMLSADSGDRFNQNTVNAYEKTNLGFFLNILVLSDASAAAVINNAAEEIGYDVNAELIMYVFGPGEYFFNQRLSQA